MKRQFIVIAAVVCLLIGGVASYFGLRTSVPNEKTMSRILADIYTADALVQEGLGNYYKKEKLEESLYSSIFSHYGLSKAQYDEAVLYYTAKPEKWSEIYEKAISILSVREGELSAFAAKCDSADLSLSNLTDSITTKFGKWASTIRLPLAKEDTLNKYVSRLGGSMSQIAVNIHIDSIRGGHITLSEKYTFTQKLIQVSDTLPRVMLCVLYADSLTDSTWVDIVSEKKVSQKEVSITIDLRDSVDLIGATAILLRTDSLDKVRGTLSNVSLSHVPYYPSDSVKLEIERPQLFRY